MRIPDLRPASVGLVLLLLLAFACSSPSETPGPNDTGVPDTGRPPDDGGQWEVVDVVPDGRLDDAGGGADGLLDSGPLPDADAAAEVTEPEPVLESFLLVGGYESFSFETKEAEPEVAQLVQLFRDGGLDGVVEYAEMFDLPVRDGGLDLWFRPVGDERSGALTADDLVGAGAQVVVQSGAATWFLVPLEGLSALFDDPEIAEMSGLEIPKGIDLKPQTGLASVGMAEALDEIGATGCHGKGITGDGIKVAVIDGGFKWWQASRDAGYLPADVELVQGAPFTPEGDMTSSHGTAVAEVIYRTAPGVKLYLIPASHPIHQLPDAIDWCINNGIQVINASWSVFSLSFYDGTGPVCSEVQRALDAGIVWVNSSGNYGSGEHWYGKWSDVDGDGRLEFANGDEENVFKLLTRQGVRIRLRWDGPDANDIDLNICITYTAWPLDDPTKKEVKKACTWKFHGAPKDYYEFGYNNEFYCEQKPEEYPCTDAEFGLSIEVSGGSPKMPGNGLGLSLFVDSFVPGQTMTYSMPENSVVDPGVMWDVLTVGAIHYDEWESNTVADYSSYGPSNAGAQKPELMAPDGVATYTYDAFFGTSASAPFTAGAAALVLDLHPGLTPAQVKERLLKTAVEMADVLPDPVTGYGKLHYDCSDCEPDCTGMECGPDPVCGTSCGTCDGCGEVCQEGTCLFAGCEGKECGDDDCGGSCGECPANHECTEGVCLCPPGKLCGEACCANDQLCFDGQCCTPDCAGKECGDDGCGGVCGECGDEAICLPDGQCQSCSCAGVECGDNGCGESCGSCAANQECQQGQCACLPAHACGQDCCSADEVCTEGACCTPDCAGKECGDDGCGGPCGVCAANEVCDLKGSCLCPNQQCGDECCAGGDVCFGGGCCTPDCTGKECGSNGCGGNCGECSDIESCQDGLCVCDGGLACGDECCGPGEYCYENACCTPECTGKECGSNGCGGACGLCGLNEVCEQGSCVCTTFECGDHCCYEGDVCAGLECCTPNCAGKECGADGCGSFCGTCPENMACDEGGQCWCGYVTCGETCCAQGEECVNGTCCTVDCTGKECGDDGCGGSCGQCGADEVCLAGACAPEPSGCPRWVRTYAVPDHNIGISDALPLLDGGYLLAGSRSAQGVNNKDIWLLRVDALGVDQWEKTWGGDSGDMVERVVASPAGGTFLCATTYSYGAGQGDIWVLRLDDSGSLLWDKVFGGSSFETCHDLLPAADGGVRVLASTQSKGAGSSDLWLLKLDAQGNLEWDKTHGGISQDLGEVLWPTEDGGVIVAGWNRSKTMTYDGWLIKLDAVGDMEWEKTYGDAQMDQRFFAMVPTSDGGYIAAGNREQGVSYYDDAWLVKLDGQGNLEWEKSYTGPYFDKFAGVVQTDVGYIMAGKKSQVSAGEWDAWLIAVDEEGNEQWTDFQGSGGTDEYYALRQAGDDFVALGYTNDMDETGLMQGLVKVFRADGSSECTCGDGQCHDFADEDCGTCPDDCACPPGQACQEGVCLEVIVVNTTDDADDGQCDLIHCSLREAIATANAKAGEDTILFDIPGPTPYTIAVQSALPDITDTVLLDGTSEPDYATKPVVEVDGSALQGGETGLVVMADDSIVRGLAVGGFPGIGILVALADNVQVTGCYVGVDSTGTGMLGNGSDGLRLNVADNAQIGCSEAGCMNIFSGNGGDGIEVQQSEGVLIRGNLIGLDGSGIASLGNAQAGVNFLLVTDCAVGGPDLLDGNFIGGNGWEGVAIAGAGVSGIVVAGNGIGSDPNGLLDLGNGAAGVALYAETTGNTIGGTTEHAGNVIAYNQGPGIELNDWGIGPPTGHALLGNVIHTNGGPAIDLGGDGYTANDVDDSDAGPNGLQNYPVLTGVLSGNGATLVSGSLHSTPSSWFRLEFFEDALCGKSGYGEARGWLGYAEVQTDGAGAAPFEALLGGEVTPGYSVAATATPFVPEPLAFGGTSEVSLCFEVSQDQDLDGHADASFGGDDCMDLEPLIHGGAIEYCDGLDNDCDDEVDEDCCVKQCNQYEGYGDDGCGGFCPVSVNDCPDGQCTLGENTENCPQDCCGTCGDNRCANYPDCLENQYNCPQDCSADHCGNDTCDKGENPDNCPADCLPDLECGDGICHLMEDKFHGNYCVADCGSSCGDCSCDGEEDWQNCPHDCGVCGDGTCTQCPSCNEAKMADYCWCPLDCGE